MQGVRNKRNKDGRQKVRLYTCHHCLDGNHEQCEGVRSPGPGIYDRSRCVCVCQTVEDNDELTVEEILNRKAGDA